MLGAIVSGASSIVGGLIGASGADKAAGAYQDAAEAAAAVTQEMFYQTREDLAPYRKTGEYAIENLLGTPAAYAATPEELNALVSQKSDLESQLNELQTKGEKYTTRGRRRREDIPAEVRGDPWERDRLVTTERYRPASPGSIAKLKSQISDLDAQIAATQEQMGEVTEEATPGLMDTYPDPSPYPDMPEYPEAAPLPKAGPYPDMPDAPTFDFGQGGVENALLSFTPEAYEQSPGYQFQVDEAQRAIENMASARGYRLSPRALKEFSQKAQGLARTDYGNWFNQQLQKADLALTQWREGRQAEIQDWLYPYETSVDEWTRQRGSDLQDWSNVRGANVEDWASKNTATAGAWMDKYNALMNLLRTGQSSATSTAAAGQNTASQVGNILTGAGEMEADKYINRANVAANALTSGIDNALTAYYTNPGSFDMGRPIPVDQWAYETGYRY